MLNGAIFLDLIDYYSISILRNNGRILESILHYLGGVYSVSISLCNSAFCYFQLIYLGIVKPHTEGNIELSGIV